MGRDPLGRRKVSLRRGGSHLREVAGRLARYRQLWCGVTLCVVLTVAVSLAEVAAALLLVPLLESVGVAGATGSAAGRPEAAYGVLALFVLAAAARSTLRWWSTVRTAATVQEVVVTLQARLFGAMAQAAWPVVRQLSPSLLADALNLQCYRAGQAIQYLAAFTASLSLLLLYLVAAAWIMPGLLLLFLPALVLLALFSRGQGRRVQAYGEAYRNAQAGLHSRFDDWISVSRLMHLGGGSTEYPERFAVAARTASAHVISFAGAQSRTRLIYETSAVVVVAIAALVAWRFETPPALLFFALMALVRGLPSASAVHSGFQNLVYAAPAAVSVDALINRLERSAVARAAVPRVQEWGELTLEQVQVASGEGPKRRIILDEVTLRLEPGEVVGVTGPSGAGKSTLMEVVLGLLPPDQGRVLLDGQPLEGAHQEAWRGGVAYVPQEVILMDGTVRENLRLLEPGADDAAMEQALRQSGAGFVLERLHGGLDARVGPGGRWLSGGERQRIGIARALLRRPVLLVLDEATGALDETMEGRVLDDLVDMTGPMALVVVSHRAAVLGRCRRIIRIENGHPEELVPRENGEGSTTCPVSAFPRPAGPGLSG